MTPDDLHAEFTRALTGVTNELRYLQARRGQTFAIDSIRQSLQVMVGVHEELLSRLKQADEQAAKAIDAMRGI